MKFSQLNIGEQFSYQGSDYTKSGPLQAVEKESGKEKMFMRAANVQPPHAEAETVHDQKTVNVRNLGEMISAYHQRCMQYLDGEANKQKRLHFEKMFNEIKQALEVLSKNPK